MLQSLLIAEWGISGSAITGHSPGHPFSNEIPGILEKKGDSEESFILVE